MSYFKKHWSPELQESVIECVEEVVRKCVLVQVVLYTQSYLVQGTVCTAQPGLGTP